MKTVHFYSKKIYSVEIYKYSKKINFRKYKLLSASNVSTFMFNLHSFIQIIFIKKKIIFSHKYFNFLFCFNLDYK